MACSCVEVSVTVIVVVVVVIVVLTKEQWMLVNTARSLNNCT